VKPPFAHSYPFDPAYGYTEADLLAVGWPDPPDGYEAFWRDRYRRALAVDPRPRVWAAGIDHADWRVLRIDFTSTGDFAIGGWLLLPRRGAPVRGVVIGHGYGGRGGPDLPPPAEDAAVLFPCFRGMSLSAHPAIPANSDWHVLYDIDKRDGYILGGCVEDLWLSVTALLSLYPWLDGHVGYAGTSFGGGIGAMAVPWDPRIARAALTVPTFGNHPLRMTFDSVGSLASVRAFRDRHGDPMGTLAFYDAATAARYIRVPTLIAAALFDPAVPPPGQFSIYNAIPDRKELFTLEAGHFEYPERIRQEADLFHRQTDFFAAL
jgi:cephalosporin-C deacetylase